MSNLLISKENAEHYIWGNKCDSWMLVDSENLSIKQELMPVGEREKLHYHEKSQQFFFILKGEATFYVEEEIFTVTPQRGLLIKPNIKHYIANESNEILEFLVISQPNTSKDRINI